MTKSFPDDQRPALDYQKPPKDPRKAAKLGVSLAFLTFVGSFCVMAANFMLADHHPDFVVTVVSCPLLLAGPINLAWKRGISTALAITIISLATFLLTIGLCSQVNVIHGR